MTLGEASLKVWAKYIAQQKATLENFLQVTFLFKESFPEGEDGMNLT